MHESFFIGAYWGARQEPLIMVKEKVFNALRRLTEVDEQFLNWYEGSTSRKKALEKKITLNEETIEKLCLEGLKRGEIDDQGFSKIGFSFGLWTGHQDDESSGISFGVGANSKWFPNSCVINIPFEGEARSRLLNIEKAKEILTMLVDIWHPEYAVLTSYTLLTELALSSPMGYLGYITYRKDIKKVPKLSEKIVYLQSNNGHWFYPTCSYDDVEVKDLNPIKAVI